MLGTKRANADAAAAKFSELAPHHRFVVIHDGYFNAAEEPLILERIEALRPDILLVAMGVPRQEFWIAKNITPRHCTLPMAVGALLDFLSGTVPRAPPGCAGLRLEWVFRLVIEPGRLWRRYILGNPVFLARVRAPEAFAERAGGNAAVNSRFIAKTPASRLAMRPMSPAPRRSSPPATRPISNAAGCFAKRSTAS